MYKTVECSPPGAAPAFRMPAARSHSWSMVVMIKQHLKQNVYEAFLERLKFIFEEFDNIYISFSGGKDSGLLLNLVLDYRDRCFPQKALGVFHQDFEAQYTVTTEYVERTFERIKGRVEPYWVCLPMATRTALSSYEMYWYPWDDTRRDAWVREMPQKEYVVNLENNPISTYRYRMHQEDLAKQFGRWYRISHGGRKTVCLLGIRADESLQRYSGFLNKKFGYKGECWISKQFKDVWCASPLYDWSTSDIWHANYRFGYDYNRLYDLYYMAGLKPSQMRVASPEMRLLYESIRADGYTMPIVCYYAKSQDIYVIVDGFHRYRVMLEHPDIYEREGGVLPVSVIDKPLDQRMASTIRHNRARGSHDVDLMSNIVKELHELGRSDAWIAKHLGMDKDELLRLKQITGLTALFKDVKFGQAWQPMDEEDGDESENGDDALLG